MTTPTLATVSTPVYEQTLGERIHRLILAIIGGHVGVLIAITVYFLTINTFPYIHELWNNLFPFVWIVVHGLFTGHPVWPNVYTLHQWGWWENFRHTVPRDALEGIFGAFLVKMALFDGSRVKKLGAVDRVMMKLHLPNVHQGHRVTPWQIIFSPFSIMLASLPGVALGSLVYFGGGYLAYRYGFHPHFIITSATGNDIWTHIQNLWRNGLPGKLIGVVGLLWFGRKVFNKLGEDLLEMFAEKRVTVMRHAHNPLTRWLAKPSAWLPPQYKRLVSRLYRSGMDMPKHGTWMSIVLYATIPLMIAAAVYGYTLGV